MLNGSTNQVNFAACQLYVPNQLVRCLLMQGHHSVVDETRQATSKNLFTYLIKHHRHIIQQFPYLLLC